MDKMTYQAIQQQLLALCGMMSLLNLNEFLDAIDRAELWAPIIDPTLYRDFLYGDGRKNLDLLVRLARLGLEIKREVERAKAESAPVS